jgi:hypothetical protein
VKTHALFDLGGRVAIVTGGNGGIGRAIAIRLAEAGAAIAVFGRNDDKNERVLDLVSRDACDADPELVLVLGFVEMTVGLRYQTVPAKRPFLVSADAHGLPCTSRAGISPSQGPAIDSMVPFEANVIHRNDHVREGGHKALS